MSNWSMNSVKCVVVGDGCVGKTCLLISYAFDKFPREHVPTIFDNYSTNVTFGDKHCNLCLFDTAGQEDYEYLRPLAYPGADIFLVCFSLISPDSFENVRQVWVPEIRQHCGEDVRFFVVGLKEDLRHDNETLQRLLSKGKKPVTKQQGETLAKNVGALGYLECSALTQKGIKTVFNKSIKAVMDPESLVEKPEKVKPKKWYSKLICGVKGVKSR